MNALSLLLDPRSIAVVGASPRGGRGRRTLAILRDTGFKGEMVAVNPRYDEVLGFKCYASVAALPAGIDCLVVAVGADAACDTLESAYAHGMRAAVVLAAGFGEGGQGEERAQRLRALGARGMSICGPNCYGLLSITDRGATTAFSGQIPKPLRGGCVALVSQSGGLGNGVVAPLMGDRMLGFRYVVSCGNQIATTVEDYVAHFAQASDVTLIAAIVEQIRSPRKLLRAARAAHQRGKPIVLLSIGRSAAGEAMIASHTGALANDQVIREAYLRRCGIISVETYDEFVETIELLAVASRRAPATREVVVISGSGGGATIAADALDGTGMTLPEFSAATRERIRAALPDFGNAGNPLDGTGAMSDDPAVLPKLVDAVLADESRAMIATTVSARQISEKERRFADLLAERARAGGRQMLAFQHSPLGGPLDAEIVHTLHAAGIPFLLGGRNAMRVLRHLPLAHEYRAYAQARDWSGDEQVEARMASVTGVGAMRSDFLSARALLIESGIPVVQALLARSEAEAIAAFQHFGLPVALKIEAPGLIHKSDAGCVRLSCASETDVAEAYRALLQNARGAGFPKPDGVLVQPMVAGVAEAYAGIINDPDFGPAISFGLGGVFVEILKDTVTEMAPVSHDEALHMIYRLKAAPILAGARGRGGDVAALAELLVRLSQFAVAHVGRFRALDLNPIMVRRGGEGAIAVDIAVEPMPQDARAGTVSAA
jgi:acetate---CoA ligase (ADP-forming)